jgi:hypothetical protein
VAVPVSATRGRVRAELRPRLALHGFSILATVWTKQGDDHEGAVLSCYVDWRCDCGAVDTGRRSHVAAHRSSRRIHGWSRNQHTGRAAHDRRARSPRRYRGSPLDRRGRPARRCRGAPRGSRRRMGAASVSVGAWRGHRGGRCHRSARGRRRDCVCRAATRAGPLLVLYRSKSDPGLLGPVLTDEGPCRNGRQRKTCCRTLSDCHHARTSSSGNLATLSPPDAPRLS